MTDTALHYGSYDTKGVCVSLGLSQRDHIVTDQDNTLESHQSSDSNVQNSNKLSTVLSMEGSFLQLNGRSTLEVDDTGIFISIPTWTPTSSLPTRDTVKKAGNQAKKKEALQTSRRGLKIPASTSLRVSCAQPTSLILSVPVTTKNISIEETEESNDTSENKSVKSSTVPEEEVVGDGSDGEGEDKMKKFLSSSIVAIPWTYVGHNLSPLAYLSEGDAKLSPEEKERIIREAEEDSITFANTVCSLAEFISSLPEGTQELCICFSCPDRLSRDALVLSIRGLSCQARNSTMYDKLKVLPWTTSLGDDISELTTDIHESDADLKKQLKAFERENIELKKERNTLTMQLVETREEMMTLKHRQQSVSAGSISLPGNQTLSKSQSSQDNLPSHLTLGVPVDSATESSSSADLPSANSHSDSADSTPVLPNDQTNEAMDSAQSGNSGGVGGDADTTRQLSRRVIELETQLSIATKQQVKHPLKSCIVPCC